MVADVSVSAIRTAVVPAALIGMVALLMVFSTSPGLGPDADFHLASVWCARGEASGLCEKKAESRRRIVPLVLNRWCSVSGRTLGVCLSEMDLAEKSTAMIATSDLNAGLYSGAYYKVNSIFRSANFEVSILAMRLLNVVLFTVLLVLALLSVEPSFRRWLVVAVVACMPAVLNLVIFVAPHAWSMIGVSFGWIFLVEALRSESFRSNKAMLNWAGFVFCGMLCLGSRIDSLGFYVVTSLGVLVLVHGSRMFDAGRRNRSLGIGLVALLGIFVAARHYVLGDVVRGLTAEQRPLEKFSFTDADLIFHNIVSFPDLLVRSIGGWSVIESDAPTSGPVYLTVGVILAVAVFHQIRFGNARTRIFSGIVLGTGLLYAVLTSHSYGQIFGNEFPPRYLSPLAVVGIASCFLQLPTSVVTRTSLSMYRLVRASALLGTLSFLHVFLRMSVSGSNLNVARFDLNDGVIWWEWRLMSPMMVWGACVGLLVMSMIGEARGWLDQDEN